MYLDLSKELSHNCYITALLGARGCGKSYGCKDHVINRFLKNKEQFIILNRTEVDKDETMNSYMNDISHDEKYENVDFKYEGGLFLLNDNHAGYAHALSKAHTYKRSSFPDVNWIIFEEFTADTTIKGHYLKNEFQLFINYLDTIIRNRDNVKIIMVGNYVSLYCPYIVGWDLYPRHEDQHIVKTKSKKIMLHILEDDQDFVHFRENTLMGQIHSESGTSEFAIRNKPKLDTNTFIMKKTSNCVYLFTFTYEGESYGCWSDWDVGLYFISYDVDKLCEFIYATTLNDHEPNKMLLKRTKPTMFSRMLDSYAKGNLRFESMKIKNVVESIIEMSIGGKKL